MDKSYYPDIWKMAKHRIRHGAGYVLLIMCRGMAGVAMKNYQSVEYDPAEATVEHNRLIFSAPDFGTFINPTRDGVIVARKK